MEGAYLEFYVSLGACALRRDVFFCKSVLRAFPCCSESKKRKCNWWSSRNGKAKATPLL